MNALPDIRVPPAPVHQQRCLARWLAEWKLDRILRSVSDPAAAQPSRTTVFSKSSEGDSRPLEAGSIRLLYLAPNRMADQRPTYVALLKERFDGSFLIAPFGRFSEPATPGEWRTRLRAMPLRVLCLWNARAVTASVLSLSWRAGQLSPSKTRQALAFHRHIKDGSPLPPAQEEEFGPPLRHPLDPRYAYLAEESALIDDHLSLLESSLPKRFSYEPASSPLLLAAESREPYGRRTRRRKKKR